MQSLKYSQLKKKTSNAFFLFSPNPDMVKPNNTEAWSVCLMAMGNIIQFVLLNMPLGFGGIECGLWWGSTQSIGGPMPISTATPSYKIFFVEYVPGVGGVVLQ